MGHLHSFEAPPHKIKIKSNFTMEKPSIYHLNPVIKVNIISNGTNTYHLLPDRT